MEDISKMANKQDLIAEVAAKTGLTKNQSCFFYFIAFINLDAISFGRVIAPPTTTLNAPAS